MGRLGLLGGLIVAGIGVLGWRLLRVVRMPDDGSRELIAADGAPAWAESMVASPNHDRLAVRFAPSTLASLELLPEGSRFYPRIVEDIAAAQHSVHVIQYGFKPGLVADSFLPVLVERAAAGVQVRMIVDAVGSAVSGVSRQMLDDLSTAGVQIACTMRCRRGAPEPSAIAGSTGRARAWAMSTTASCTSSTVASAGWAGPASRTTSRMGGSTTCSCASPGR